MLTLFSACADPSQETLRSSFLTYLDVFDILVLKGVCKEMNEMISEILQFKDHNLSLVVSEKFLRDVDWLIEKVRVRGLSSLDIQKQPPMFVGGGDGEFHSYSKFTQWSPISSISSVDDSGGGLDGFSSPKLRGEGSDDGESTSGGGGFLSTLFLGLKRRKKGGSGKREIASSEGALSSLEEMGLDFNIGELVRRVVSSAQGVEGEVLPWSIHPTDDEEEEEEDEEEEERKEDIERKEEEDIEEESNLRFLRVKSRRKWMVDVTLREIMAAFPSLQHLTLTEGSFSEPLEELGMSNLLHLDLSHNAISGPLPDLLSLNQLSYLDLSDNKMTGPIPESISTLSGLSTLFLNENELEGEIPFQLFLSLIHPHPPLPLLSPRNIDLSQNQGLVLPSCDYMDDGVTSLSITGLPLRGMIPPSLSSFSALKHIDLSGNKITGPFPPSLCHLPSLTSLLLFSNRLEGCIPSEISLLSSLNVLSLDDNRFTGDLPSLSSLPLTHLFLNNNRLKAFITPSLLLLFQEIEKNLSISGNKIKFDLPEEEEMKDTDMIEDMMEESEYSTKTDKEDMEEDVLFVAETLTSLILDTQGISGFLPPMLFSFTRLTILSLSSNKLQGPIPPSIGRLVNLSELSLDRNKLTGPIPEQIGGLVVLRKLNLENNRLTGFYQFSFLVFNGCWIGSCPSLIRSLPYLKHLSLEGNMILLDRQTTVLAPVLY